MGEYIGKLSLVFSVLGVLFLSSCNFNSHHFSMRPGAKSLELTTYSGERSVNRSIVNGNLLVEESYTKKSGAFGRSIEDDPYSLRFSKKQELALGEKAKIWRVVDSVNVPSWDVYYSNGNKTPGGTSWELRYWDGEKLYESAGYRSYPSRNGRTPSERWSYLYLLSDQLKRLKTVASN